MKLVVTIDTEEDNWLPYSDDGYTVRNIARLPKLHGIFLNYGMRPTYLVSYQVAADPNASATLADIRAAGGCEIGAHCHPWSTPPFSEARTLENSMMFRLPADLLRAKMQTLGSTIFDSLGVRATAFRSGRWGYGTNVAEVIRDLGYRVDSSVTAYIDWGEFGGPDFSAVGPAPFRFSVDDIYRPSENGSMLQVPATVGFLQDDFDVANIIDRSIRRTPLRRLRLLGVLDRIGWVNKIWLSPEMATGKEMIALARHMRTLGYPVLNMFLHSSTLTAGLTPFVKTRSDEEAFLARIRTFLAYARDEGLEPATLSEVTLSSSLPQQRVAG